VYSRVDQKRGVPPGHRGPARGEGEGTTPTPWLWTPWLRINRVLRVMLHTRWSGGVARRPCRVQAGARAAERDPARGVVQLAVTTRCSCGVALVRVVAFG
jgi:hypothetical protein